MSTHETPKDKPSVALIAGPTASGKSAIALELADALKKRGKGAVIINADSMQVYADIPVLSAAPVAREQERCEHRLYGAWDGAEACSAADWAERAKEEIATAHRNGALPILVGGTGMYMQVLLDGIAPIPAIDPDIRMQVRAMKVSEAYAALQNEDAGRAEVLEPTDSQRIARALEVIRSTGKTLAEWHRSKEGGIAEQINLHPLIMLPERDWLYERCDARFAQMCDSGAIEEVEALLARNLDPDLPVMRAIGVPEIASHLREEIAREDMLAKGAQATRNYAKRQFTWFRNQPPAGWCKLESQNYETESIFELLLQH
jgi:tRNA dimethylallyltransferase